MKINWTKLLILIVGTILIGSFFAFFTIGNVYESLNKPFQIPSIVFPLVWTVLYTLMGISLYIISNSYSTNKLSSYLIYIIQLIVNSLWTLIFFGFNKYFLGFIWILFLIILVIIMIINFCKVNKKAAILLIPYLIWTIFAAYLNFMIYILN